jgi:hypothetical protein
VKVDEEILLMADVNCQNANRERVWFLDSRCSHHMCGKKKISLILIQSLENL